jgi:hypothetical protein
MDKNSAYYYIALSYSLGGGVILTSVLYNIHKYFSLKKLITQLQGQDCE